MKIGRNDRCPCGSGKKFKKCCHLIPAESRPRTNQNRPIRERNLMLLSAMDDIFGFNKGITWDDFRRNLSDGQVQEFYRFLDWLWPMSTDVISLLPAPSDKLRGFYIGETKPYGIVNNLLRYSLYTDEIIVTNPFHHPRTLAPDFNPIIKPSQYKQDTLEMVFFVAALSPWIAAGIVHLIPDPGDFDYELRRQVWRLAEKRYEGRDPLKSMSPEEEKRLEAEGKEMLMRMMSRLPEEARISQVKKALPHLTDEEVQGQLEYMKKQRKAHKLWLDQPLPEDGELRIMRMGANLEMGLFIAQLTGSYLYTNRQLQWNEILSAKQSSAAEPEIWSPLTQAFQQLEFDFLDNVDSKFVVNLKEEQRLESLRNYLRRLWNKIDAQDTVGEATVRQFKDELIEEHAKAKDEWKKIDVKLRDWVLGKGTMASGVGLGLSQILTGGMNWQFPAAGFCISAVNELLNARAKRESYRANTPLSVFIDLDNKGRLIHK